jgi:hypothetical protein
VTDPDRASRLTLAAAASSSAVIAARGDGQGCDDKYERGKAGLQQA